MQGVELWQIKEKVFRRVYPVNACLDVCWNNGKKNPLNLVFRYNCNRMNTACKTYFYTIYINLFWNITTIYDVSLSRIFRLRMIDVNWFGNGKYMVGNTVWHNLFFWRALIWIITQTRLGYCQIGNVTGWKHSIHW